MTNLLSVFLDVVVPVFALVIIGYYASPKLNLDSKTLSRFAYYILIPAFTFDILSTAKLDFSSTLRMMTYAIVVHLACALLAFMVGWGLGKPGKMIAAYISIAIFGNVGNFGLPLIKFRFPDQSQVLEISTIYFLAIMTISFVVNVGVANWHKGGSWKAMLAVLKTPALLAVPPAFFVNYFQIALPPMATRPIALLAAAMIPTMLIALGAQLATIGVPKFNRDMLIATSIRLIGGPVLAIMLAIPFGVTGFERSIGIIQASMPTAVLASIIAVENDLLPDFVIGTVLFSTLASLITLTLVLTFI